MELLGELLNNTSVLLQASCIRISGTEVWLTLFFGSLVIVRVKNFQESSVCSLTPSFASLCALNLHSELTPPPCLRPERKR